MNITNKIGMFITKEQAFLVVRKEGTTKFCIPGGCPEPGENDIETLQREIREELGVKIILESLRYVGVFLDVAVNEPDDKVRLKLFFGEVIGNIQASSEIEEVKWFNPKHNNSNILAPGIKEKIVPCLTELGYF